MDTRQKIFKTAKDLLGYPCTLHGIPDESARGASPPAVPSIWNHHELVGASRRYVVRLAASEGHSARGPRARFHICLYLAEGTGYRHRVRTVLDGTRTYRSCHGLRESRD